MESRASVESSRSKSLKYHPKFNLNLAEKRGNEEAKIPRNVMVARPASFSVQDGGNMTKVQ